MMDGLEKRSCANLRDAKRIEEDIIHECKKRGTKWTDRDFPCSSKSLYTRDSTLDVDKWQRLGEMGHSVYVFVDGSEAGDVVQGELGDCWMLGAMSVVATRDDLLFPLFVSAHPEYGFYQVKFYKNAKWRVVTIDDFVPMKWNQIRFGKCADKTEIWVPLMEKAFAKLNGNYENCASGHFGEGMTDLTGEGCETYDLKGVNREDLWKKLMYFSDEAFLMGCSMSGATEADNGMGLLSGHAYAILRVVETSTGGGRKRLLQIRNPWGQKEWTGAWSDGASEWTDALRRELDHHDEDDGTFFMEYSDWLRYFTEFCVCRLLQDEIGTVWEKRIFHGEWTRETAGGCGNTPAWKQNDQFWVKNNIPGNKVFFHLAQADVRSQYKPQIEFSIGLYLMKHDTTMLKKDYRPADDVLHKPTFINRREYAFSLEMEAGTTVLMPCTFSPGEMCHYYLTVYSEQPLEAGKIGQGPAPKEKVEVFDMSSVAWLNQPGIKSEKSGTELLRSPRKSPRSKGGLSPRRAGYGGRSPRGTTRGGGGGGGPMRSPRRTGGGGGASAATIPSSGSSDPMVGQALDKMEQVTSNLLQQLQQCERHFDEATFDDATKKLRFVDSKVKQLSQKPLSSSERSRTAALEDRLRQADRLVISIQREFKQRSQSTALATDDLDDLLTDLEAIPAGSRGAAPVPRININPEPARPIIRPPSSHNSGASSTKSWSIDQVVAKLTELHISDATVRKFRDEKIDGEALCILTERDLKEELQLPLGDRKKLESIIRN